MAFPERLYPRDPRYKVSEAVPRFHGLCNPYAIEKAAASFYEARPFMFGQNLEHRAGIEPAYTGFADLRVSHFATDAF